MIKIIIVFMVLLQCSFKLQKRNYTHTLKSGVSRQRRPEKVGVTGEKVEDSLAAFLEEREKCECWKTSVK